MIDRIIHWSLNNRMVVILGAVILFVWGGYEALRMPVDVFPDLAAPTVTILADAHGMAPEEVENLITFPVETTLNGAAGIRRIRSSTSVGVAIIWVEFDWGTDIYRARQIVTEKLQLVMAALPPNIDPPILAPISSLMNEVMYAALTSDRHSPMDMKTLADWTLRRRLLSVPGVSQVIVFGGETRQYQVILEPERLAAYGLSITEVSRALDEANRNTSAGFYVDNGQEYLIHAIGRLRKTEDIEETLVAMRQNVPVLVRDIAEVRIGSALKRGIGSHNLEPAVILGVQKQPGANTLELTERLDVLFEDLQASLPEGMKLDWHIFRQADFIDVAVRNVVSALRDGALLVIVIVFLFLMSARATGITVAAIPLSLLAAIIAMKLMGATINTMTLGGMAIAVGALVDDAIIDVENVTRRLRENTRLPGPQQRPAIAVIFDACREVRNSIVFATVIIILVFLPLFFLSGVEGLLLKPLGFAYILSLAASLIVALTVTPALCYLLLPNSGLIQKGVESPVVRWLKTTYGQHLDLVLQRWKLITVTSAVLLLIAVLSLTFTGRSFLPEFNEGTLTIAASTVPGTSMEQSAELGAMIERILLNEPEVVSTARRTGRAEQDEHVLGVNSAEIDVSLRMQDRSKAEFLAALRKQLSIVPGMSIIIGQPISHRIDHMLSGTRANIAVKIFGEDLYVLRDLAARAQQIMSAAPGVVDLSIEQQTDIPILTIKFNRPVIARYGLTIEEVSEAVETAFYEHPVSRVLEGRASFDLVMKYYSGILSDLETVKHTLIMSPTGAQAPLHALAEVRRDAGPNMINRENGQRKIVVSCNVAGGDLVSVVQDIRSRLNEQLALPTGYHLQYGGQFESAESASRVLLWLTVLVVIGIFMMLFVALHSVRDAMLVMVNLPLALIGGIAGVFLSGGVVSVASLIGFITLFGIATRNGLMLISHIRHLIQAEGVMDVYEAVKRGALERVSPIKMTALATALALVPLALGGGRPGSEIETPMAIVILCGLLSSTVLNMVVVPTLYLKFGEARKLIEQMQEK